MQELPESDVFLNHSFDLNLNSFFPSNKINQDELVFQNNLFFMQNPESIETKEKKPNKFKGIKDAKGIKYMNGTIGNHGINTKMQIGFSKIKEKKGKIGVNRSSKFNFNENDLRDNIDFSNNINLKNFNVFNPSYINMKVNNSNDIYQNLNNNLFNMQSEINNIKSINNKFNCSNINNIRNINNINNINNTNNINNVIFTNNFTNFNISSLNDNKLQMLKNLNKNKLNMYNININELNNITSNLNSQNLNNEIKNEKINNIKNINIYNTINNINDDYINKLKSYNLLSLKEIEKQYNIKNSSILFFDRKKNNKKKNSLFQNETNKEKDIRDFKRFCDGLKSPLPEYICSQIGSRIMQKYLNRFPPFIITNLIEKINIYFEKIMCDVYGNYFCQKLYSISSIEQRRMILNSMKDIFINISQNSAGAHVAQSIIELSEAKEEKDIIMDYIKGHEMQLALHPEGTHVLQKIVQIFAENERQALTDVLCTIINVYYLCQDLKGISVIKRLISFNKENNNRIKLVEAFFPNILEISKSSSGSYIIQFLIEQWGIDIGLKLIHFCILNFEAFAINKHSANLINKIILICLKRNCVIMSINASNINLINCNEIIIINALKGIILEPNKVINVYKNKFGRALIIKIRKLFNIEENKKLYLLIKSLENTPNYLESKKYKIYVEIFESQ